MAERESLSPRTRFEVFKRDGFRCRYCGATAMLARLTVDHVLAVANGGTNDPANLVTACAECNGGKSAVPLEERRLGDAPDPAAIREHAQQVAEYLDACRELDAAREEMRQYLANRWLEATGDRHVAETFVTRLVAVLNDHGLEMLNEAIAVVGRKRKHGTDAAMYFNGVIRKMVSGG